MVDLDLIERCRKKDRKAQELIYNVYGKKFSGVCQRYARGASDIEDIFQEAFLKVFKNINDFKVGNSFEGWIRTIIIHTAIDHFRKNKKFSYDSTIESTPEYVFTESFDIFDDLSAKEIIQLVQKLPDGYRLVFNLFAIEGYSHKEISKMLNISECTSQSQYFKAKKYMIKLIQSNNTIVNESGRQAY